ncbi:glycoside hydrolase superfamily [Irpex lacteus]|nr:glycoside hydrolase superfamily [Irpex lacteus]
MAAGIIVPANNALESRSTGQSKAVIVQMFEWTWDSIASECTNFLGPAGYGYVQTSPPQEHVAGSQWWTDYQPVSYILTSKRGNRSQFANMINTCHKAGIKVIADTIFNHMTGSNSGTGVAGSSYTHYNYPRIYQNQDFHHCGLEPNNAIVNYNNAAEVQTCELVGLADLATNTEYVRSRLAQYGNDLLSLGVDGLRLDAAKHISVTDLSAITSRLNGSPYLTLEVIYGAGEPITPNQYVGIGDVQEFRYTTTIKNAFLNGAINGLQNFDNLGWVASNKANVFVTNHDTERNGNALNNYSPSNTYVLALIFSLAHPYGTVSVLSSYSGFNSNSDAGAPNGGTGTCTGTGGSNGWFCQHRWIAVQGMVAFRNTAGTAALQNWQTGQSSQIAFDRGTAGFVAINNADSQWAANWRTGLQDGVYCNVIAGTYSSGKCSGNTVTVKNGGHIPYNLSSRNAVAIHINAKLT